MHHTQVTPPGDGNPVDHHERNGWTVLGVATDIDICSAPAVQEAVVRLLDAGRRHFVLDLSAVRFLDSMGGWA